MGEDPSARTERELIALRAEIDSDVTILIEMAKRDIDPRNVVRRSPAVALGAAGAALTAVVATLTRRGTPKRKKGEPRSERAKEAGLIAGSTALTSFAVEAARRLAVRLFDDERGR